MTIVVLREFLSCTIANRALSPWVAVLMLWMQRSSEDEDRSIGEAFVPVKHSALSPPQQDGLLDTINCRVRSSGSERASVRPEAVEMMFLDVCRGYRTLPDKKLECM